MNLTVYLKKLNENAVIPSYATAQSAGVDLSACIQEPCTIEPGKWKLIPTGVAMALPSGFEAQIRSRSGLSLKHGVIVLNTPGTVDADYRGEVRVILANFGDVPFNVEPNMRIAQMVISKHETVKFVETDNLDETNRGAGGFGSTGH